jgi:prepilin-type N-terminal cleavage/methylation domain-containing protein/prepilin-type processing-associated H-X9-DG protein
MKTPALLDLNRARNPGFTLVELLVVIGMVAVLGALLLPALAGTKPNAQPFQCLENERQLIFAWQMYAEDNSDILPPNDYPYLTCYAISTPGVQAEMKNWVVGTMEQPLDAVDQPAFRGDSELLDPNTLLSPYIKNTGVYRCPADSYINPYSRRNNVRSYSMNSAVGTIYYDHFTVPPSTPIGTPVGGGWLLGSSYNANQTAWLTYGRMSSFSRPGPANTFVFMDESAYSINDGCLDVSAVATPGHTYLIDYPAGNHNGAAGIAFADGHAINHKWQDALTYTPQLGGVQPGLGGTFGAQESPDNPDCFFLAPITSAPR